MTSNNNNSNLKLQTSKITGTAWYCKNTFQHLVASYQCIYVTCISVLITTTCSGRAFTPNRRLIMVFIILQIINIWGIPNLLTYFAREEWKKCDHR